MRHKLYAVYDDAVKEFGTPLTVNHEAIAIRIFQDIINNTANDPNNMMAAHPTDFSLWYLGDYNSEDGVLVQDGIPHKVVLGIQLKGKSDETTIDNDAQVQ